MPNSFVVDASVVAKWFNKGESNEAEALALRNAWVERKVKLYSSSLVIYEVCNSIWKNPNINPNQAASLSKLVVRLAPTFLEFGDEEASETMNLARKTRLTFYDAIYVVLSKNSKFSLLTADRDQLDASEDYTSTIHLSRVKDLLGA